METLKFYLGSNSGDIILVDAADTGSFNIPLSDSILWIGMDSIANTSGKLEGVFDPLLGMYWAWNTGYIQLKLTGVLIQNHQNFPFEYHIGGYRWPHQTHGKIQLMDTHSIHVNLDELFLLLPIQSHPRIMIPGPMSKAIFTGFISCFE